jgi:urate oxidase
MDIVLGQNRYGKAETRVLRVTRQGQVHEIKDLNVSTALSGDFEAVHLEGDNANVLTTDAQKNTVYAFAAQAPPGEIEDFALKLARHFVAGFDPVMRAQVRIEEYPWARIPVKGSPHGHAFVQGGTEKRRTAVTCEADRAWVVSGLTDLVVLKSSGSEFWGYLKEPHTTLPETRDRILATAVTASWLYWSLDAPWGDTFAGARRVLLETFAGHHSLSLQQTLFEMGRAVLEAHPEIAEIRLSMPNRHHIPVDLAPFGLENENEVFFVADRPYGLIEAAVRRQGAPGADLDWPAW